MAENKSEKKAEKKDKLFIDDSYTPVEYDPQYLSLIHI